MESEGKKTLKSWGSLKVHPQILLQNHIYLAEGCNLRCRHCWQAAESPQRSYAVLKFEGCDNFLNDAVRLGLKGVIFSGGEPLLNREFPVFAEYFHRHGVRCTVETNGMLISGETLAAIVENEVKCAISLDGRTAEVHNAQRGRKDAFEKTVAGMRALEAVGFPFQVITAISKLNYHEMFPLLDWLRDEFPHCTEVKINPVVADGRALEMREHGLLYCPEELPKITDHVGARLHQYPFRIMLHIDRVFFSTANLLKHFGCGGKCGSNCALSILADGRVSICSLGKGVPEYIFGSVLDIDLIDLWENNSFLQRIGDISVLDSLKGICSNCIFKRRCGGSCRAWALRQYGDFFGPSPICQAYYDAGLFPESRLISRDVDAHYTARRPFGSGDQDGVGVPLASAGYGQS